MDSVRYGFRSARKRPLTCQNESALQFAVKSAVVYNLLEIISVEFVISSETPSSRCI
jgi:hypothetical protein